MIRPPSNQKQYDDCYSRDAAFTPMPDSPSEKQIEDRARLVRIAREQGDWKPLIPDGQIPTVFTFKPLRGSVYRKLMDKVARGMYGKAGGIGSSEMASLAFRCAFVDVSNLGIEHKVKFEIDDTHDDLGLMAHVEFADLIDGSDVRIIAELGGEIVRRAREVSPK